MASTTSPISISSSTLVDTKAALRHTTAPAASSQCVTLPTLPPPAPVHSQTTSRAARTTAYCRKIARNVVAMATGEVATAEVATTTELPEFVKTIQKTWDKVEDKYAVTSLAVAGAVGLWASTGVVSALDKLPVVPGLLELVGIGYTGVFVYNNLVYKPDREALIQKVKDTYKEILGTKD
ncbi:PREDICTED: protein CURVATURE THYLAKOID 1B, chloroplastic [Ipomoea nil]|uniref:protein CURVATURE THYLAKOID 1B, chloroplastic n=1 Tax=Ipomoea nil TaxID=35883 RepID=UPI000901C132|nr:PREDICTED: protein CURVATURE THYLAKOID 1B, chloroplastic [Ipomoea nil]XP_019154207.1 PREDICTED: protein CURVATURE THYLAKOID 1B, chloroplastic [Ipomoea nil]